MKLSLVIPAYNDSKKTEKDILNRSRRHHPNRINALHPYLYYRPDGYSADNYPQKISA